MRERVKIGISSCLLGENVRYDGGHKLDHYLKDTLGQFVEWVPVCPEVESGLPVPREAMHLVGDPEAPRLVTRNTGIDHTDRMLTWAKKKLGELEKQDLSGFIFKSRSPSSGMQGVKIYAPSGMATQKGIGIFARAFMDRFSSIPVEDDGRLQDPGLRENFIERVFIYRRWFEFKDHGGSIGALVAFHTEHKLLIMSHSIKHLRELGALVSNAKKYQRPVLLEQYFQVLMDGLRLRSTVKKHVNVLQHMAGYFKQQLSSDEKHELLDVVNQYHKNLVPLIVPITLIRHYVRKFDEPYLKRQYYLNPHPMELMLRNHV
jgi:uncharacterized protein YbgA (DUF1722 family)/uncharacterized protein YbbK (DUF523 family)